MKAQADPAPFPEARVLVVDDDREVCSSLARALTLLGYGADEAGSGSQALAMLASTAYDLAVVDIVMPEVDGIEVLRWVRRERPHMPVILLTAHPSVDNAVAGLRLRADDYLRKPVSLRELAETVAAVLQQHIVSNLPSMEPADRFAKAGPVTLDREKQTAFVVVRANAEPVRTRLTSAEEKLLACLMKRPAVVTSYEELATALGYDDVSGKEARNLVRPHVSRLRGKIEPGRDGPQLILTVPGGYTFNPGPY